MKVAFSLSPGVVATSTIIAAGVMSAFVAPSSRAGIVVENVHRSGRWFAETVEGVTPYLNSQEAFDTTSTFDAGRYDNWRTAYFAGVYRTLVRVTLPSGDVIDALAEGYAVSLPYHDVMGSYIGSEALMYSVGGNLQEANWTELSIRGVLDATFVISGPSQYDFHSWGDGAVSIRLWNESGEVILDDTGTFSHQGVLGPGRYRVLSNFDMVTRTGNRNGGMWVSIPTPGAAAMLGAGVLVAFRRRR